MSTSTLIIDTDIHPVPDPQRIQELLPQPWRRRYASGNRSAQNLGYWNVNGVMRSDAVLDDGTRIETVPQAVSRYHLDAHHIAYGVLNVPDLTMSLSPEPDYAAAVISATNDVMVQDWLTTDNRFRLSIHVSLSEPTLAVREIHRLGDHPAVAQVLMPGAGQMPLGNRYYHPIYAAAVEHDLPVAIHPGPEGTGISGKPMPGGYPSSYLEWHTGLATVYIHQLISLITEGVFAKFPTLRFVMIEGGILWLPPILWRLDKNWKALRQTSPWIDRLPSEIVQEHILMTTQPIEEPPHLEYFRSMLEMFDAGQMIMFSSDFPHWDGDTPDFSARHFPDAIRARVMGENARALYKLSEVECA